jgi:hypothetical protein
VAKDPKPENGRPPGGASRGGSGGAPGKRPAGASRATAGSRPAGKGRTRPPVDVVSPQRPWGLIIAAVVVVAFAVAAIGYAVVRVNEANADRVTAADQIEGLQTFDYAAGQEHVTTPVTYDQTPPVGGPHDYEWADCTGTVYDGDIRHENAVHSMEHGATWITYDPARVGADDVATLADLVEGTSGLMLSRYEGQSSPISLQSWNHQLSVDSVTDERIQQYADFMTFNDEFYPEVGASCENPAFIADPLIAGDDSRATGDAAVPTDAATTPTPAAGSSTPAP